MYVPNECNSKNKTLSSGNLVITYLLPFPNDRIKLTFITVEIIFIFIKLQKYSYCNNLDTSDTEYLIYLCKHRVFRIQN